MTDNPLLKYMPQENETRTKKSQRVSNRSDNPLEAYLPDNDTQSTTQENTLEKYTLRDLNNIMPPVNPLEKYASPGTPKPPSAPRMPTSQGRFSSGVSNVARSFLAQFAGVPKSIAIAAKKLADATEWTNWHDKPLDEYATYKLGKTIEKAANDLFPTNPKYQDEFITTTLTGGVGSALGFLTTMLASKGVGLSEGAVGLLTGAATQASQEYERAIRRGATEEEAFNTWVANLPIGATEVIPFTRALGRINNVTKGWLGKVVGNWGKEVLEKGSGEVAGKIIEGGLEEAIQEAFQNFASNATAKELYDTERSLWEGVGEGGLAGLIIGMGLNGLGIGVQKRIEKLIESDKSKLSKDDRKLLENWAKTQVDESEWIDYLENGGETPVDIDFPEAQAFREAAVDNKLPAGITSEEADAIYRKPTRIKTAIRLLLFPEFIFKRLAKKGLKTEAPMRMSVDIISGQLSLIQHERDLESLYKKGYSKLSKKDRHKVREAIDLAYSLMDKDADVAIKSIHKNELAKMYTETPGLKEAVEATIKLFERVKARFQKATRNQFLIELDQDTYKIFSEVIDEGKTVEQAVVDNIDIEGTAKKEFIDRQVAKKGDYAAAKAERDWNAREKVRNRKIEAVKKREVNKIRKLVDEYSDIADWGIRDFQTRIELGNYKITDADGKTVAWAQTVEEAKQKASEIRNRILRETGKKPKKYIIEPEVSRINPTAKRKGVLHGEVDIFESLPRYIHAMEKRIVMGPIIAKFKKLKKEMPEDFTPDVNAIIQQQINAVMGSNYEWIERIADEISVARGWKTGKYRKLTGFTRKIMADVKLGYRISSAFINGATGFGMTYVKVGSKFWVEGSKILRSGEYTDSEGNTVNIEELIKKLEDEGQLGVDFAVQDDGTVSPRLPIWHPLRLFQLPEGPVRRHSFAANYVLQRELYGKSHEEAVWLALQGVRFQQSTYNTAAIPELFRSPTGKLLFQFKSFMVNQMQLWSSLSKAELLRMIEVQLLLAGPRGFVYFLKSIPILGFMGLLDDIEKELVRKDTLPGKLAKGVPGLANVDISAPATFQFPSRFSDWLGPTISSVIDLFREVVIPGAQKVGAYLSGKPENAPNYTSDNFINWAKGLSPIVYYWDQLLQSVLWWESWEDVKDGNLKQAWDTLVKNAQTPNIWIRDSNGNKAYQIGGVWDRIMLLTGAKLAQQSEAQALEKIWNRNMEIRAKNRKNVVGRVLRNLQRGQPISEDDAHDLVLYGVDPNSIPDRFEWSEMTPEQRAVLKTRIIDKAEAIDHFNLDEVRRFEP